MFDNHHSHNSHRRHCGKCKGYYIDDDGYKHIFIDGKMVREHRYFMEQHLCRKLDIREHVHHINGDIIDNRLENLLVLDIRVHGSLEGKKGKGIKKTFKNGVGPWNYAKVKRICQDCGVEFLTSPSHKRKYCSKKCYLNEVCSNGG